MIQFNNKIKNVTTKDSEEFQVVIKLRSEDNNLRLTYKNKKSATLVGMEEIKPDYTIKASCQFKGRKKIGDAVACDWMYEIKKAFSGMKPNDWMLNKDIFVDAFYKIH